ncbi:hypothetical protein M9Y10_002465 [Tritrichomonas musculus]|uniref:Surface antigen BspA-like n=1 Tax=Tritrichomonas musculus TaxID=1915356 RepID=A0ABR2L9X8_9EUKA
MGCEGFNGTLTMPDSVTSIGKSAFEGRIGIIGSLTIPDIVTNVGKSSFANCEGFNDSLTLSKNLKEIKESSFCKCSNLKDSLTIPNGVTVIATRAFELCSSLTCKLDIPESLENIYNEAFQNLITNQFIQIDDHQAFASTQLSLVSFKGLSNIHCGSEVFSSSIKVELPPNYQQAEFCGIKVEKPDFISSDSELVITSDQEPGLEISSDQEISLMSSSNQIQIQCRHQNKSQHKKLCQIQIKNLQRNSQNRQLQSLSSAAFLQ